jgi:hypothetical protein
MNYGMGMPNGMNSYGSYGMNNQMQNQQTPNSFRNVYGILGI